MPEDSKPTEYTPDISTLPDDFHFQTIARTGAALRRREISPVDLTEAMLARIEEKNGELNAYLTVTADLARLQAARAESERLAGLDRGPLHGIPVAVKDLCFTRGIETTGGMKIYRGNKPAYDATVVTRLRDAGSVLLGKLHMTEGATLEHHPDFAEPRNPWREDLWTGVSSSGSGIAPAAGLAYATVGSDTGVSIRYPCAVHGLTGVKPTWGRVSRHGIFDLCATLDHLGPMARSAADAAAMLGVLAGHDPNDPTSLNEPVPDYLEQLDGAFGASGASISVDWAWLEDGGDPSTISLMRNALSVFSAGGARVREDRFPDTTAFNALVFWNSMVEMAAAHAGTFPERADEYGEWLRAGLYELQTVDGVTMGKANIERHRFTGALLDHFDEVGLVAVPVFLQGTPTWGELRAMVAEDITKMVRYTSLFNASGAPTITFPIGITSDGRPVGMQLAGTHGSEAKLLRVVHAFQQRTDHHTKHPEGY